MQPDPAFAFDTLLVVSDECLKPFVALLTSEGTDRKKNLQQLTEWACIQPLDHVYRLSVIQTVVICASTESFTMHRVEAILDAQLEVRVTGKTPDYTPEDISKEGWLLESEILFMSEEDAVRTIIYERQGKDQCER